MTVACVFFFGYEFSNFRVLMKTSITREEDDFSPISGAAKSSQENGRLAIRFDLIYLLISIVLLTGTKVSDKLSLLQRNAVYICSI